MLTLVPGAAPTCVRRGSTPWLKSQLEKRGYRLEMWNKGETRRKEVPRGEGCGGLLFFLLGAFLNFFSFASFCGREKFFFSPRDSLSLTQRTSKKKRKKEKNLTLFRNAHATGENSHLSLRLRLHSLRVLDR